MRIRIKKKPDSLDVAEFEGRTFRVGETIEVPARLATLLIVTGCGEPVSGIAERTEAADDPSARQKKPEKPRT